MTRRLGICCVVAALAAGGAVLRAAESLRIVPTVGGDRVLVSFELSDAFTDEIRETISSGLRTTFTYDVELRMVVPAWVDRTVATSEVSVSDEYDNLTRRHTLTRIVDGRVEDTVVTEDEAAVKAWLTSFTRMPLCRTAKLDASRDYYVRIRARSKPHGTSLLGWASTISGEARFTFVP